MSRAVGETTRWAPKPGSTLDLAASLPPSPAVPQDAVNALLKTKQPTINLAEQVNFGLLVSDELDAACERVRKKVERIAKSCRAANRRFRDIEFDLEKDSSRCLNGLSGMVAQMAAKEATASDDKPPPPVAPEPPAVMRVTQIFDSPQFFIDGSSSSDVEQGRLGDCWFLDALATVAVKEEVLKKICVAMDEKVGVYGFVFQRDGRWVDVIIDDMLFVSIPEFEVLSPKERNLFHLNKDRYNKLARRGGKSLWFAKGTTENETWVPLMEKAYAKLHGDYNSLNGGVSSQALEDITGGVSSIIQIKDILDTDAFWKDELLTATKDRLISCCIQLSPLAPKDAVETRIQGLQASHAYSILGAIEHNGKRFVRVRNPWADTEWTGRWSDGSREWTKEWLDALIPLEHKFGDDGAFIMEYEDFLDVWTQIDRVRLFDDSWIQSSLWANVTLRPPSTAWDYGDASFTFTVSQAGPCIVVLSQLDARYFEELSGSFKFSLDFIIFKRGEEDEIAESRHSVFHARSLSVELDLEEGEYIVHVRVDRTTVRASDHITANADKWELKKFKSVAKQCAISTCIAVNNKSGSKFLSQPVKHWAGRDIHEIEMENVLKHQGLVRLQPTAENAEGEAEAQANAEAQAAIEGQESALMQRVESAAKVVEEAQVVEDPDPRTSDEVDTSGQVVDEPEQAEDLSQQLGTVTEEIDASPVVVQMQETHETSIVEVEPQGADQAEETAVVVGSDGEAKTEEDDIKAETGESAPQEGESGEETPAKPVHSNFICDGCRAEPIVGDCMMCLDCADFCFCEECFAKNEPVLAHQPSHAFLRLTTPVEIEDGSYDALMAAAKRFRPTENSDNPRVLEMVDVIQDAPAEQAGEGEQQTQEEAPAQYLPTHENINCDGCGIPAIVGVRYKCMEISCPAYDLCANCNAEQRHANGTHRMMPFVTPAAATQLKLYEDNDPEWDVTLGLRVYTKRGAPTEIKAQLRHGNIVRTGN